MDTSREWKWEQVRDPGYFELRRAFSWLVVDKAKRLSRGGPEELPPGRILEAGKASEEQTSQRPEQLQSGRGRSVEGNDIGALRNMWCSLADFRFGGDIADRVQEALAQVTDEEQLFEIGECLAHCDTGDEFLEYVGTDGQERRARDRVGEWPRQWMQEGREEGFKEGFERGREKGREEGLGRGLEHERALLRRMAEARFGAAVDVPLIVSLACIANPERLAEVGEWLVRCDTANEFLARVRRLCAASADGGASSRW